MEKAILSTNRLLLREFEEQDLDIFTQYRNNVDWMIHQSFKGKTKEEYKKVLLTPLYFDKGNQLAIVLKDTNVLVGDLYIEKNDDELFLGYTIRPDYARKGYAYEIVKAFIEYLFKRYPKCKVVCETDLENIPSIKLLNKLGFTEKMKNEEGLVFELHYN